MNGARADLWILPIESLRPERLDVLLRMLSADERARAGRFVYPHDAATFVLSHALVRTVLSRYAPVAAAEWCFTANAHGRPEIDDPRYRWLRFNLSHTSGCAVVAVTRARDIGVDVEALARRPAALDVADRYFSPAERDELRRAAPGDTHRVFLELWTMKEAYIKARGVGIALGLQHFSCRRGEGNVASLSCSGPIDDDGARWHIEQFTPTPVHVAAVAVARAPGERVSVFAQRVDVGEL